MSCRAVHTVGSGKHTLLAFACADGAEAEGQEEETGETAEQSMMRRVKNWNVALRERPHELQLWLDFAAFQDEVGRQACQPTSLEVLQWPGRTYLTEDILPSSRSRSSICGPSHAHLQQNDSSCKCSTCRHPLCCYATMCCF